MMKSKLEIVSSYASSFRELINAKVTHNSKFVKDLLRLNREPDWDFLCTSMDILSDASYAIGHVQRFGLDGATKYDEVGERYLRLYGLLSATYIQQQAILEIYKIMNVPNLKDTKIKFDGLEIRALRHKLAAHSTDYLNDHLRVKEAYFPVRLEFQGSTVSYAKYTGGFCQTTVDLPDAINKHLTLVGEILDDILQKSIITLYSAKSKRRDEWEERLSDLRVEKNGGMVIRTDERTERPKIVITFTGT